MSPEHGYSPDKPFGLNPIRSRNQLFVFIICLFISAFIWLTIVLSKEANTSIDFPVTFENVPANVYLVNKTDSVFSITVSKGNVALIILKYLSRRTPIRFDLSKISLTRDGNYFTSTVSTADAVQKIIDRLNLSDDHVSFSPAAITLRFETVSGVKVKVRSNLILEFEKQFQLSQDIQIVPDSVTIVGPQDVINRIEYAETINREIRNINQSQNIDVLLSLPEFAKDAKCIPEKVNVILTVDKFTESEIEIPIVCNYPEVEIKTFPDRLKITYFVTLDNYKRIHPDMFLANIEYAENHAGSKLKVNLLQYPTFIKIIKIEPEEVEFLILKK